MRRIIAVVDSDLRYASRLAAFFNSCEAAGLKAVSFSDPHTLASRAGDFDVQLALVEERRMASLSVCREMLESCVVVPLSEDGLLCGEAGRDAGGAGIGGVAAVVGAAGSAGVGGVYKYIRADRLLRQVMLFYAERSTGHMVRVGTGRSRVTAVFSPLGRCGKTAWAMAFAQGYAARGERVLLLSLDEYSGWFRRIAAEAVSDMSDVIYAFRRGNYSWQKLSSSVYSHCGFDYVPPVRYGEDLMQITTAQMSRLIGGMVQESGYERIVLDIGSWGRRGMELLDLCDVMYLPVLEDTASRARLEEFREAMEASGRGDLVKQMQVLPGTEDLFGLCAKQIADAGLPCAIAGTREEEEWYGRLQGYAADCCAGEDGCGGETERTAACDG